MKKFNVLMVFLFTAFAFANLSARAQDSSDKPFRLAVEVEGLAPLGNFGDAASAGVGAGLKGMYKIPGVDGFATGTIAFNYFAPKSDAGDVKYTGIPVKIGYQAILAESFYIEPQLGLYSLRASEDGISASTTNFLAGAQVGYNITPASHIGLGYYHVSADGGSISFIGANFCISF